MEFIFIFSGVFLGLILQIFLTFVNGLTDLIWYKKFFNAMNRLALHGLLGGLAFVFISIMSPGGALWGVQLYLGGFLVLGSVWCRFVALVEKRRLSTSA